MQDLNQPLTDDEFERLADFLYGLHGAAMTLEELDGFFCALICGPELVPPSEYCLTSAGGELYQGAMRATARSAVHNDAPHSPLEHHRRNIASGRGIRANDLRQRRRHRKGNEWAIGFEHGIDLRRHSWRKLVDDDEDWEKLAPVILLAHEHDPDPKMRSDVFITPDKREEILCQMAGCTLLIYDFFREWAQGKATQKNPSRRKRRDEQ